MMGKFKFIQKFKNSSLETKIKILSLATVVLVAAGLVVYKLSIPETKAYFRSEKYSEVKLTVTNNVYDVLSQQIQSDINNSALHSVSEDAYRGFTDQIQTGSKTEDGFIIPKPGDKPEENHGVTDGIDNGINE